MKSGKLSWWIDGVIIFALTAALILPFFSIEYLNLWSTIESSFIAQARLMQADFPAQFWTSSWYCGTRSDYLYPPALMGLMVLVSMATEFSLARSYHLCVSTFYALGMVGVYLLSRAGSRSRPWAWIAALAAMLLSPSLLFINDYRSLALAFAPQQLMVLAHYGEGPHISSLAVLSFALAATIQAFRTGAWAWVAAAALASALVVSLNFYGAVALALFFPLLAASFLCVRRDWTIPWRSVVIALAAYGLTAWWLVPSYFHVTARNLRLVAQPGNTWSLALFAVVLVAYAALLWWRLCRAPTTAEDGTSDYRFFIFSGLFFAVLYVLGHRAFGFQVVGDSNRLVPELELFMVLGVVEGLRALWNLRAGKITALRIAIVLVMIAAFTSSYRYLARAHQAFPADLNWRRSTEFKTQEWLHRYFPGQRVLITGSHRFWHNVWRDGPQMGGASDQGILHEQIPGAWWQAISQSNMELTRLWLQALAVDVAVIPGKDSREAYHDIKAPELWDQTFPLLRDDGEGNRYYRIPRGVAGLVQIVPADFGKGLPPVSQERDWLERYVLPLEAHISPNQATLQTARPSNSKVILEARLDAGEALLFRETFDKHWEAQAHGQLVPIERDPLGFMLIKPSAGQRAIELTFREPQERRVGFWIFAATAAWVAAVFLHAAGQRYVSKPVPQ